ncbi:phenylalanine--tRNA ligase subunit beta [Ornithinimicrobium humiphilum]|uniref:Phenylalanine--tRNA ligase beta subunit n=1 Tax=Ornithinimicrobium humiphilum TaxID=125288 RepID=A0A543KPR5_9MICO|nr:phenylalanine--tRNA ligase subunit beta [Ornithinimicrobium humiphilum]TQM97062.1 phenylalanyl-tRNA synthetase beta subunit [Ornithinimicrobium humiphilum]
MRVPVDWLGDYVELPEGVTGEQIAADLVAVGLEEEGLHTSGVSGPLVVGRVLEKHPEPQKNGKTINWCQVDVGPEMNAVNGSVAEGVGIVCGAHNFEAGDLVAVILPGGVLPTPSGPMTISARKTYGHVSAGMICSVRELGIGDDHDGIIVLPRLLGQERVEELGLAPGDDLIGVLGLDREVVEVNVTPDRGYCFSIRGIAREYSHSTGAPFRDPADLPVDPATEDGYAVELRDEAHRDGEAPGCDRYVARIVRGIDLTRQTPEWMARRLTEAGMRPIGLAVDVTNYVMLALGQPLHAFDLATLDSPIVVRRARAGERLRTLDDVDRELHPEDLLITCGPDGGRILALAGVMGGEDGEVTPGETTDVLVESAHFDPRTVARTSRRHKLSSEAAKRFERGVDPGVTAAAAQLAVDLLVELGGGTADAAITDRDERASTAMPAIELDLDMPTRYVGVDYGHERVVELLRLIGCEVSTEGSTATVVPPTWRPDLTDAPTLVEEVARIDGYDKIPSVVPRAIGGRGLTHGQRSRRAVAYALAGQGLHEVLTYPFVGTDRFDELGLAAGDPRRAALRLANPLSDEAPFMRTELLQTLPEALRRNISRGSRDVALFEIDTVTVPHHAASAPVPGVGARPDDATLQQIRDAVPHQPWHVAVVAAGQADRSGWWGEGRPVDVTDVVGWAHSVADTLGVPVRRRQGERAPFHPGRCVELLLEDGTSVGWAGELHPKVVQRLGLPPRTSAAELDLDVLVRASDHRTQVSPLSTQPVAGSDVALVVPRTVRYGDVEESLRAGAGELLEDIALFDVYVGDQLGPDQQSLAFRMHFRAPDRTLTTEEVNAARDAAVDRAARDHGAVLR